ncbi:MAG: deoxyribonuclease V [Planctomycetota bacterium]|nr:deoxyribonuclease V [Planctomycetota bacterium]
MNLPRARHRWNISPKKAVLLQRRLASEVMDTPLESPPRRVAAGDVSVTADGSELIAGWVVWDVKNATVLETVVARQPARFPYVPGLLSFREAPSLIAAARKLVCEPDVFMMDGQGLAHPRRFGIACHFGVLIDRPTLGCAKSRLCGIHDTPADAVGASKPLHHEGQLLGRVVRTRPGVNPVYVSIGHRIALADAIRLTLKCCTKFRLPEPCRLAHQLVTKVRMNAP